jgi:hypothetical protein
VLAPVALIAAFVCGWLGLTIGRVLSGIVNIQNLEFILATLAGFDALGVVALVHIRRFRGSSEQRDAEPLAVFLMFVLIGGKCVHGMGINTLLVVSVTNGVVGSLLALGLLRLVPRPGSDEPGPT